jgi:hypothetical protein
MMRGRAVVLVGVALALGSSCRDRSNNTDLRTLDADEMARQGKIVLADSQVVSSLRTPNVPGRIVYDKPVDLSLANAIRTRPDLVKADTSRVNPSGPTARHDTTGGDATADTSGGAVKPRPRRP